MKVRISIPGTYMAMEMEEEQARATFHKMAELLWLMGGRKQVMDEPGEAGAQPENPGPSTPTMSKVEAVAEDTGVLTEDVQELYPKVISSGYGGFLYIRCPACGKTKGFCAKARLNNFRCDCGAVTRMENMVPLFMKCECGRQAKYLTNMTDKEFDITCYDCGAPVAVGWNEKKQMYETLK